MKDLLKVKKGITHAGKFHTDDVLSTVLIQEFNPNIEIIIYYIDSWIVREITSSCCSLVNFMKFTA